MRDTTPREYILRRAIEENIPVTTIQEVLHSLGFSELTPEERKMFSEQSSTGVSSQSDAEDVKGDP